MQLNRMALAALLCRFFFPWLILFRFFFLPLFQIVAKNNDATYPGCMCSTNAAAHSRTTVAWLSLTLGFRHEYIYSSPLRDLSLSTCLKRPQARHSRRRLRLHGQKKDFFAPRNCLEQHLPKWERHGSHVGYVYLRDAGAIT